MNRNEERLTGKFLEFEKMFPPFIRNEEGLCIDQVAEGWEWCFNPEEAFVLEKIDGTNVKLEVVNGVLSVFARNEKSKGYIKAELNDPNYKYILQGVANYVANRKKRMKDGVYYGELIGEKIQGNPYKVNSHTWVTFVPNKDGVKSYKDFPKNAEFEEWKNWILNLNSLFNTDVEAEGVIFLNKKDGRMAKLRKDMFSKEYKHR